MKHVEFFQKVTQLIKQNSFKDLAENRQNGNRTVIIHVRGVTRAVFSDLLEIPFDRDILLIKREQGL